MYWLLLLFPLAAIYAGISAVFYVFQHFFFFRPERLPTDFKYQYSFDFEEKTFEMEDGVSINAGNWWQREDGYWALRIVRPPTRTVQAQNRDHDAEMFRRGWVAGQADALKQIDAARAEERERCAEIAEDHYARSFSIGAALAIRARSGARGV